MSAFQVETLKTIWNGNLNIFFLHSVTHFLSETAYLSCAPWWNDDAYWHDLEEYFGRRLQIKWHLNDLESCYSVAEFSLRYFLICLLCFYFLCFSSGCKSCIGSVEVLPFLFWAKCLQFETLLLSKRPHTTYNYCTSCILSRYTTWYEYLKFGFRISSRLLNISYFLSANWLHARGFSAPQFLF